MASVDTMRTTTLYFAGPLFTQGERLWNAQVAAGLREQGFDVILPQETAEALMQGGGPFDPQAVFAANVSGIDRCDAVVAVLDGADPDSGTCWECGYAYRSGKPVIGVRTDFRAAGDDPGASVNLMLSRSCAALVEPSADGTEGVDWVISRIVEETKKCLPG